MRIEIDLNIEHARIVRKILSENRNLWGKSKLESVLSELDDAIEDGEARSKDKRLKGRSKD